jgi:DNA-nicking Smr family endonuclease
MARRARALTEIDAAEWASFARKIRPLRGRQPVVPVDAPAPDVVSKPSARVMVVAAPVAVAPPLGVGGQPAGVDAATWQRFQRGKLGTTRKLDLHGMTAQHAFQALRGFLRAAQMDRLRCVEIVTGRGSGEGGGVLRRELPMWLNLPEIRPLVLAASHPHAANAMHAHMANAGSVRLLLRRLRV